MTEAVYFHFVMELAAIFGLIYLHNIAKVGVKIIPRDKDEGGDQRITPPPSTPPTPDKVDTLRAHHFLPHERRARSPELTPGPMSRVEMAASRAASGLLPATFHYIGDVPRWMLEHPIYEAVWDEIKTWDINVPTEYGGYMNATGSHCAAILLAIMDRVHISGITLVDPPGVRQR